jgi:hypothetical protein
MIILDDEQGSPEWLKSRLGRPSASMFAKLITSTGKPSVSADKYINNLVAEKITGRSEPLFISEHMQNGTDREPFARKAYEYITDNQVRQVGFCLDDSEDFGCSPDGLILSDTLRSGLEIKCPAPGTHVEYMRNPQKGVTKYYQQIQGCMWITDRPTWDFFSWHPQMPHVLVTVERDDKFIEQLSQQVHLAVNTINETVSKHTGEIA